MSALFDFNAFVVVALLAICCCTYVREFYPALLNSRHGFKGILFKASVIGTRLSPLVSIGCIVMAFMVFF